MITVKICKLPRHEYFFSSFFLPSSLHFFFVLFLYDEIRLEREDRWQNEIELDEGETASDSRSEPQEAKDSRTQRCYEHPRRRYWLCCSQGRRGWCPPALRPSLPSPHSALSPLYFYYPSDLFQFSFLFSFLVFL